MRAQARTSTSLRSLLLRTLLVAAVMASASLLVANGTRAAFVSTTVNDANAWEAGSVTISDDDGGFAMFDVGPLLPGDTGENCIEVTYNGNVTAGVDIVMYAATSGNLAGDVDVAVEIGTGGGFGDCTGFAGASAFTGTLTGLSTAHFDYGSGITMWSPGATGQSRVVRITWTLGTDTLSSQQGETAAATFTWQSQG